MTIVPPIPWLTRSPGLLSRRAPGGISPPPVVALGPVTPFESAGTLATNSAHIEASAMPDYLCVWFV